MTAVQANPRYRGKMDEESIPLCDAINRIPGLLTVESCCGHGKEPFRIWLLANDNNSLAYLLFHAQYQRPGWTMQVTTDGCGDIPTYRLEGPVGGYEESYRIAADINGSIEEWLNGWIWVGAYEFKTWDEGDVYFWTGRKKVEGYVVKVPKRDQEALNVALAINAAGHEIIILPDANRQVKTMYYPMMKVIRVDQCSSVVD